MGEEHQQTLASPLPSETFARFDQPIRAAETNKAGAHGRVGNP